MRLLCVSSRSISFRITVCAAGDGSQPSKVISGAICIFVLLAALLLPCQSATNQMVAPMPLSRQGNLFLQSRDPQRHPFAACRSRFTRLSTLTTASNPHLNSGIPDAFHELPCSNDPRRSRGGTVRAYRQSGSSHRRKGRNGRERLA
jgi:hypothetical protein